MGLEWVVFYEDPGAITYRARCGAGWLYRHDGLKLGPRDEEGDRDWEIVCTSLCLVPYTPGDENL